jgi:hypothetical protein
MSGIGRRHDDNLDYILSGYPKKERPAVEERLLRLSPRRVAKIAKVMGQERRTGAVPPK